MGDERYAVDGWDPAKPEAIGAENYDRYAVLVSDGSGGWQIAARTVFGSGFDEPVATITSAGLVTWFAADRQGSVESVFDNSGAVLASATYDPFGNILSGGVWQVTGYGFQGGSFDSATGLENFGGGGSGGGRWYDSVSMQWLREDPLGLTPDANPRRFVGNDPTNGTDPSGRWLITDEQGKQPWLDALRGAGINAQAVQLSSRSAWYTRYYLSIPNADRDKLKSLLSGLFGNMSQDFRDTIFTQMTEPNRGHLDGTSVPGGLSIRGQDLPAEWVEQIVSYRVKRELNVEFRPAPTASTTWVGVVADPHLKAYSDLRASGENMPGAALATTLNAVNDATGVEQKVARQAQVYGDLRKSGENVVGSALVTALNVPGEVVVGAGERVGEVYREQRASGASGASAAAVTGLYSTASVVGLTSIDEAVRGTDISGKPLGTMERWSHGLTGFGSLILSGVGGAAWAEAKLGQIEARAAEVSNAARGISRELAPDFLPAVKVAAAAATRIDGPVAAIPFYERAVAADPFDPATVRAFEEALRATGDPDRLARFRRDRELLATATPWADPRSVPAAPRRQRVSLTLIVRDEEANLPACLDSARDLVDEVVVDTGSTDRTVERAVACGARVVPFTWCDDFAAARNAGLDAARGDWVFWLDADERLDPANRDRVRRVFAGLRDENAAYLMRQLSPAEDAVGATTAVDQVRLFRLRPDVRWEYRIHEQILLAIRRTGASVRPTDVVIDHHGYQGVALRNRKLDRNTRLLELAHRERPADPILGFNLAWVYHKAGRSAEALPLLEHCRRVLPPRVSIVPKVYRLLG